MSHPVGCEICLLIFRCTIKCWSVTLYKFQILLDLVWFIWVWNPWFQWDDWCERRYTQACTVHSTANKGFHSLVSSRTETSRSCHPTTVSQPKQRHQLVVWEKRQNDLRCDASLAFTHSKPVMCPVCVPVLSCTEDTVVEPGGWAGRYDETPVVALASTNQSLRRGLPWGSEGSSRFSSCAGNDPVVIRCCLPACDQHDTPT